MAGDAPPTFSESWYRIASQRLHLRSGVRVQRQNFRGQRWYVLENPFSNQFFRLRPEAYEFVARLSPDKTVQQVWQECLDKFPDGAPGQEAVLQLLAQLYYSNLLQYDLASDASKLFKRFEKAKQRETRFFLLNLMFMRFPLLDPDQFLTRTIGWVGKLISPMGAVLWFALVGMGIKVVIDHFEELKVSGQGVLAPDNLFLLYVGLVFVKTLHEFGHAFFCKRYGGEVHTMGVMLMIFTPIPYMDATSAWGFRNRWQRVLVGSAGMIVELALAGVAALVWARTGPGALHSLAYNIMFVASVSTLIFNLNPLLRYDGYYILTDLVEIPNLQQRSQQHLRYLAERYLFGVRKVETPARGRREAAWFTFFGLTSGVYRIFVFGGILLFVADQFLLAGIIMAVVCVVSWIIAPVVRLCMYLAQSPRLERNRSRAVAVSSVIALVLLLCLEVIPFPYHFRAPGVLRAREWTEVMNETAGTLEVILTRPGGSVTNGQPLMRLSSRLVELEVEAARATLREMQLRVQQAMKEDAASVRPLTSKLAALNQRLQQVLVDQTNLIVRARKPGLFIAPQLEESSGRFLAKGSSIGIIVDPSSYEFVATVPQKDGDRLFTDDLKRGEARLNGQAGEVIQLVNIQNIPAEQNILPSAALGWAAGGEVQTASDDPQGRRTAESFFQVKGDVVPSKAPVSVALFHGRAGQVRFDLKSEPLLPRWIRQLRQLLQKRYQI